MDEDYDERGYLRVRPGESITDYEARRCLAIGARYRFCGEEGGRFSCTTCRELRERPEIMALPYDSDWYAKETDMAWQIRESRKKPTQSEWRWNIASANPSL